MGVDKKEWAKGQFGINEGINLCRDRSPPTEGVDLEQARRILEGVGRREWDVMRRLNGQCSALCAEKSLAFAEKTFDNLRMNCGDKAWPNISGSELAGQR